MKKNFQSPHPRKKKLKKKIPPQTLTHQTPHAPLPHPRHPPPQKSPNQP